MNREGDQSPSRLTVAQAALLNLKGGQLQTSSGAQSMSASMPGLSPPFAVSSLPTISGQPSFTAAAVRGSGFISPTTRIPSPLAYDPLLTHEGAAFGSSDSLRVQQQLINRKLSPSPLHLQHHLDQRQRMSQLTQRLHIPVVGHPAADPSFLPTQQALNVHAADIDSAALRASPLSPYDETITLPNVAASGLLAEAVSTTRAQNGYTPLEREILQNYLQRQQLQQQLVQERTDLSRAVAPPVSTVIPGGKPASSLLGRRLLDPLPSLSEEDFHSQSVGSGSLKVNSTLTSAPGVSVHLTPVSQPQPPSLPPSRLAMDDINAKINFTRQRNQTHTSGSRLPQVIGRDGISRDSGEERTRSTTVPEEYLGRRSLGNGDTFPSFPPASCVNGSTAKSNIIKYGSQASGSSIDSTFDSKALIRSGTQHNCISKQNDLTNITDSKKSVIRDSSPTHATSVDKVGCNIISNSIPHKQTSTRIDTSSTTLHPGPLSVASSDASSNGPRPMSGSPHACGCSGSDGNDSPLDSPALTYSNSTRTPNTLSPSTPFSAFAEHSPFEGGVVVASGNAREEAIKVEVGLGVHLNGAGRERAQEKGRELAKSTNVPPSADGGQQGMAMVGNSAA